MIIRIGIGGARVVCEALGFSVCGVAWVRSSLYDAVKFQIIAAMSRKLLLLLFVFLAGVAGFVVWKQEKKSGPLPEPHAASLPGVVPDPQAAKAPSVTAVPTPVVAAPTTPEPAAAKDAPPMTVQQRIGQITTTLEDYRRSLGENPVGSNAEIMQALRGANSMKLQFPTPSGSGLNADGELLDEWGTPYFFHQLSKTEMEIRSAGPDKKMWTEDDAVSK